MAMSCRENVARAYLAAAVELIGGPEPDQARHLLGVAKHLAESCGAAELVATVVNTQRRLGARLPRPRTALSALTGREREVAQAAVEGLTNDEIARRLFLRPKTVEGYLTSVYRKLGGAPPARARRPGAG